jgi:hypothetical protein
VRIDIDDYTSVIEQFVLHHVTNRKTGTRHPYHRFMPNPENVLPNELRFFCLTTMPTSGVSWRATLSIASCGSFCPFDHERGESRPTD